MADRERRGTRGDARSGDAPLAREVDVTAWDVGNRTLTGQLDDLARRPMPRGTPPAPDTSRGLTTATATALPRLQLLGVPAGADDVSAGRVPCRAYDVTGSAPPPDADASSPRTTFAAGGARAAAPGGVSRLDLRDVPPSTAVTWSPMSAAPAGDQLGGSPPSAETPRQRQSVPPDTKAPPAALATMPHGTRSTPTSARDAAVSASALTAPSGTQRAYTAPTEPGASMPLAAHAHGAVSGAAGTHRASVRSPNPSVTLPPVAARAVGTRNADATRDIDAAIATESVKLGHAFAAKREALQSIVGTQTAAIMSAAAVTHASTVGALTEREQRVQATFAGARATVRGAQATQVALARVDVATALDRLHGGTGGVMVQVHDAAQAEAMRMQTAADNAARNVAASSAALRADIVAGPIGDLRTQVPDIEPDEARAVETAIGEAKASAATAVLDANRDGAEKLHTTAVENGATFTSSAASITDQVSAKLPEIEQSIRSAGEAVVTLIEKMAGSQLAGIDVAERQALAQLAEAKAQAANLLGAGRIATDELGAKVNAQLANLSAQEAAAQEQLHAAGGQAGAQLATHRDATASQAGAFATQTRASLQEGARRVIATLEHATTPALGQLSGASAAFGVTIRERRDHLLAGIDSAIGAAGSVLAQRLDELTAQCTKFRGDASATYGTAEAQLVASAQPAIQSARDEWRTKADEFNASTLAYESEAVAKHAQVRAELPAKMTQIVHDTIAYQRRSTARKIWDGVKSGLSSIGWGLVKFVAAVVVVAAVIVAFVGGAFVGLAVAIALLVVGAVMLAVGILTSFVSRLRMLWNTDWPWWAKIIGIPVSFGVAVGDALGLSQITEAIRGRELISDRILSTEERSSRMTEGLFQVITFGFIREITRGRGAKAPHSGEASRDAAPTKSLGEPLPSHEPAPVDSDARPQGNAPPEGDGPPKDNVPPKDNAPPKGPHLPPGYDPASRTTPELQTDRRPAPRTGETLAQARARVHAAEDELLRRAPAIYDALGESPREVNPRVEDPPHQADGAHTTGPIGKHGADIPLRRGDNPDGRTIEGRIYGNPPWPEPHHSSSKWFSDLAMVRSVNEYMRVHWDVIRQDLALFGEHSGFGNAGSAIGEGFRNMGTSATPVPLYLVTSLFRITIRLVPGPPVDFFVLTSFPSPTGPR